MTSLSQNYKNNNNYVRGEWFILLGRMKGALCHSSAAFKRQALFTVLLWEFPSSMGQSRKHDIIEHYILRTRTWQSICYIRWHKYRTYNLMQSLTVYHLCLHSPRQGKKSHIVSKQVYRKKISIPLNKRVTMTQWWWLIKKMIIYACPPKTYNHNLTI
jgi:hypothetical protein